MQRLKLSDIVRYFIDSSDTSEHQFRRLYNIAIRGSREFNMDITGQIKTVVLPVSSNGGVAYPADYMDWVKVGIVNNDGGIVPFRLNQNRVNLHNQFAQFNANQIPQQSDAISNISPTSFPYGAYWWNFFDNGIYYQLYGVGGGTVEAGQFSIDDANCCIWVDTSFGYDYVVLEYLSDGFDCGEEEFMIHPFAEETMMCYIRWKNATDLRKKFSGGQVQEFKREYYREKSLSRVRINKTNIDQMEMIFRDHIKLAAKA